jgi:hypothetical protein
MCGDSQQEPVNHPTHEPPCDLDQNRDPCSTTINAQQTKDPEEAKGKCTSSCEPFQSNACSSPECSVSLTTPNVDRPESYPSIAVVVPVPPCARGKATRATTRVARVTCKKRLNQNLRPSLFVIHWVVQTLFHVIVPVLSTRSAGEPSSQLNPVNRNQHIISHSFLTLVQC